MITITPSFMIENKPIREDTKKLNVPGRVFFIKPRKLSDVRMILVNYSIYYLTNKEFLNISSHPYVYYSSIYNRMRIYTSVIY